MADMKDIAPFSALEWMLAGRYLRGRGRDRTVSVIAGFSLVGIALGVIALLVISAIFEGALNDAMKKVLGLNGHIELSNYSQPFKNYDQATAAARDVPGVVRASPVIDGQVMASSNYGNRGVLVRGVRLGDLEESGILDGKIKLGTLRDYGQREGVVIGLGLARSLGLNMGDKITLIAPKGRVTPFGTVPRIKSYPILAIFQMGLIQYDNTILFMPLKDAQLYFQMENEVSSVAVYVENPRDLDDTRDALKSRAISQGIQTWAERDRTFFSIFAIQKRAVTFSIALIILVAALNIISGLTMLVKDKSHDIAIMRTMGATRGTIMRVFFIAGASIGVAGTLLGLIGGLLICWNIETIDGWLGLLGVAPGESGAFLFDRLRADVRLVDILIAVGISLGLSFLATLYPSWRAAKLDPVEALRYE